MRTKSGIGIGALAVVASLAAVAHHGAAGLFDEDRTVEVTGTVVEWFFVNPHPLLIIEASDDGGDAVEWDVYFGPGGATIMRSRGFSQETFSVGETVVVTGHPAVAEGVRGIDVWGPASSVTRPDGTAIP